jgi:nucleoside-diphosphate-sugar epimerase
VASTHIVTGGTGFVGSALILELLRRTDAHIVALTRAGESSAQQRLHETLTHAAHLYGWGDALDEDISSRCEAVIADLHEPCCGIQPRPAWAGAQLWHCAASLQFMDRHEQAIFRTNVEGTRHVVEFARAAGIEHIDAISTAYVAGTRSGVILEAPVEEMANGANNHYERSKIAAEAVLANSGFARVRVLRPSIVIGHSQTLAALNFNGLYGFLRAVHKFRRLLERTQRTLGDALELRIVADVPGSINLIPVDHVVSDAVGLFEAGAPAGYYHLTTTKPPPTDAVLSVIFRAFGMRPAKLVDNRDEFTWLDKKFNARTDFYNSYLVGPKQFSRVATDAWVANSPSVSFELDEPRFDAFCRWYIDGVLAVRKPLTVTR